MRRPADSGLPHRPSDYLIVTAGWAVAVVAAALFPLDHPQVARVALFVHLMSMAVGFGAVVMIDVYGLLWMFGHRRLSELTDLSAAAHGVIAFGVGGLLASGIALKPDLTSPLARLKLVLVLLVMLNGTAAQRRPPCGWGETTFAGKNAGTVIIGLPAAGAGIPDPSGTGTSAAFGTGVPQFRQVELRNANSLRAQRVPVLAFLSSGAWNCGTPVGDASGLPESASLRYRRLQRRNAEGGRTGGSEMPA